MTYFSLIKNDRHTRVFAKIGIGGNKTKDLLKRIFCIFLITYAPLSILIVSQHSWLLNQGVILNPPLIKLFFRDYAAIVQYWIFLPFCLIAEILLDTLIRRAVRHFIHAGIIRNNHTDINKYKKIMTDSTRLRDSIRVEILFIIFSYIATIYLTLSLKKPNTWQWILSDPIRQEGFISWAGWWWILIANPLIVVFFCKWIWRIVTWTYFLWKVSKLRLNIYAGHPDRTGGLLFLGRVQSGFGIFIFAVGANFAALTGYKVFSEGMNDTLKDYIVVWSPIIGYIIFAPTLFLAPLFAFTKQLWWAKEKGIIEYSRQANQFTKRFESKWLKGVNPLKEGRDVSTKAGFDLSFESMLRMRIVPFDIETLIHLLTTAGSPMLPLLLKFFPEVRAIIQTWGFI